MRRCCRTSWAAGPAVRDGARARWATRRRWRGSARRCASPRSLAGSRGRASGGSACRSTATSTSTSTTTSCAPAPASRSCAIDPDEVVERYRGVDDAPACERSTPRSGPAGCSRRTSTPGRAWSARCGRRSRWRTSSRDHRLDARGVQLPRARSSGSASRSGSRRAGPSGGPRRPACPSTCTGDILTAVAMLTTKRLGGAALYHEIEAIDYATGRGRHRQQRRARPRLAGARGAAPAAAQRLVLRQGPALRRVRRAGAAGRARRRWSGSRPTPTRAAGSGYVVARGELTARRFPETGTAQRGVPLPRTAPVEEAWARWAGAGVNHHSSATPGDLSADVAAVARHLGIEAVVV